MDDAMPSRSGHPVLFLVLGLILGLVLGAGGGYYFATTSVSQPQVTPSTAPTTAGTSPTIIVPTDRSSPAASPTSTSTLKASANLQTNATCLDNPSSDEQKLSNITTPSCYKTDTTIEVGTGTCGNASDKIIADLNKGSRKSYTVGNMTFVLTPNTPYWSNSDFTSPADAVTFVCGAGGVYPLHAYTDQLLWVGSCGSGYKPNADDPGAKEQLAAEADCGATQNLVSSAFGLK